MEITINVGKSSKARIKKVREAGQDIDFTILVDMVKCHKRIPSEEADQETNLSQYWAGPTQLYNRLMEGPVKHLLHHKAGNLTSVHWEQKSLCMQKAPECTKDSPHSCQFSWKIMRTFLIQGILLQPHIYLTRLGHQCTAAEQEVNLTGCIVALVCSRLPSQLLWSLSTPQLSICCPYSYRSPWQP